MAAISPFCSGPWVPVAKGASLSDLRQSIASLWHRQGFHRQQASSALRRAAVVNREANSVHDQLERTQQTLQAATDNYYNYFNQMRATEAKLVVTRRRVQLATAHYQAHKAKFASRLGSMQRHGQPTYLQVVFGSQTFSDLTRRTAVYETLTEHDAQLQAQIKADRAELQTAQAMLMSQWQQRYRLQLAANSERVRVANAEFAQARQLRQLNNSRSELVAYAAVQEQSSRELGSMIGDLQSRRAQIIAEYDARAAAAREARQRDMQEHPAQYRVRQTAPQYARRIQVGRPAPRYAPRIGVGRGANQQLAPMPIDALSGNVRGGWIMPARGPLSSRFGMRFHPILHREKLHTGDDIAAPMGSPIRAAKSGRVLWAGWKKAYGNTIIVDVGGGYTVLYGHASKLGVQSGQPVNAGEYIGNVGSTGFSTGPHLHFEVRKNGRPIDPTSYLKRR